MNSAALKRYIPLILWGLVICTLALIPFKITSYGYLPGDDALRHAGKAVSGKSWPEIMVMRPEFSMDHNSGWHAILGWIHRQFDVGTDGLVVFSVVALLLLVLGTALPWCKRPEAWAATLLIFCVAYPPFIARFCLGRPFLLTIATLLSILFLWRPQDNRPLTSPILLFTTLAIAASVWIHGSWCLLVLPVIAFLLAGRWRHGLALAACWIVGSVLGASLTGHPWQYLGQSVRILTSTFGQYTDQRLLVGELRPSDGGYALLVVIAFFTWRRIKAGLSLENLLRDPIFVLLAMAWIGGLKVYRFWDDWGIPTALVWCLMGVDGYFTKQCSEDSPRRLLLGSMIVASLFFITTSDLGSRWTNKLTTEFLNADDPEMKSWLPGKNGIFYSADMTFFYKTFFKNPTAPWRYILGFESTFMPEDDLKTLRSIQWNYGAMKSYAPWVDKMRPEDRLQINGSSSDKPPIPRLEWNYTVSGIWLGRLPQGTNNISNTTNSIPTLTNSIPAVTNTIPKDPSH